MTAQNLLLKINTKLDGVNCRIAEECRIKLFDSPVMILAASLSHSMGTGPTVAAVAASVDGAGAKYIAFAEMQRKTHFIEGIKELTIKALKGFYKGSVQSLVNNERNTGYASVRPFGTAQSLCHRGTGI